MKLTKVFKVSDIRETCEKYVQNEQDRHDRFVKLNDEVNRFKETLERAHKDADKSKFTHSVKVGILSYEDKFDHNAYDRYISSVMTAAFGDDISCYRKSIGPTGRSFPVATLENFKERKHFDHEQEHDCKYVWCQEVLELDSEELVSVGADDWELIERYANAVRIVGPHEQRYCDTITVTGRSGSLSFVHESDNKHDVTTTGIVQINGKLHKLENGVLKYKTEDGSFKEYSRKKWNKLFHEIKGEKG